MRRFLVFLQCDYEASIGTDKRSLPCLKFDSELYHCPGLVLWAHNCIGQAPLLEGSSGWFNRLCHHLAIFRSVGYSFDLKCPSKPHVFKGFVPRMVLQGGGRNFRRQDLVCLVEDFRSCGVPLKGCGTLVCVCLSVSHLCCPTSFIPQLTRRGTVLLPRIVILTMLFHHQRKATEPFDDGLKPL